MFIPLTQEQYNKAVGAGFSPQQIVEMEKRRKIEAESELQEPNYIQRLAANYSKNAQDISSGIQQGAIDFSKGIQQANSPDLRTAIRGEASAVGGLLRSGLRTVGGVASSALAPITEAPLIKPTLEAIGSGIAKIPGVETIVQKAHELALKHPESAKDLQNIIDIATLGVGSGIQKPVGIAVEKTGIALEKSGITAANAAKNSFAQELVSPVETGTVKLQQVARTTEAGSFFKKDTVTPTVLETKAANEVAQIPGISPKNTFQKNFNLIRDFNVIQAKQLESDIAKYDFAIPRTETLSRLKTAGTELQASPLIVGDAEKTAQKLLAKATQLVAENAGTGSGLLKARKQFDQWVLNQKPKIFDANSENALTLSNKAIRDTFNTLLDEKAPNLGIKDSLQRQFSLYTALDNIAPKAAQEANTPILRAFERVGKTLGVKSRLVQGVATAVGIGGLGAAATFAPAVAILGGTGFLTYQAGKLVMKPAVRIALGKLLQTSGKLLNPADRAILQRGLDSYGQ